MLKEKRRDMVVGFFLQMYVFLTELSPCSMVHHSTVFHDA